MKSIYDLSWSKTSFLSKLRLLFEARKDAQEKMKSSDVEVQASGYSALSSTYYSILSTAFAQFKASLKPRWLAPLKVGLWSLTWFPLAVFCYLRMLPLSNKVVELVDYFGMSADQCDIRQSILRSRGLFEEAKSCIEFALGKKPKKAHTRGLLHLGLAEVRWERGNRPGACAEIKAALDEVGETETEDPRQAVRIYRGCADLAERIERESGKKRSVDVSSLRLKAQKLAEEAGARDQALKAQ